MVKIYSVSLINFSIPLNNQSSKNDKFVLKDMKQKL